MIVDDATKPREKTEEIISKLLSERQDVLVRFCRVAGLDPFTPDQPSREMIEEFCQVLVDYSAFGHFEIYSRILSGEERRQQVLEVANRIYPQIAESTEFAVAFNDKYDALTHTEPLDHLNDDLAKLGEEIAMRIDVEDQLLTAMLAEQPEVA
jgi:regulator of sigma D